MKASITRIPTVYGMGCAGLQCGGGLGQTEDDGSTDGSANFTTTIPDSSIQDMENQFLVDLGWGISPSLGDSSGGGSAINTTNGTTATGTSTASVASAISAITNSFTSIFKAIQPLPAGCTQVAGPYGTSTQCATAGSAQTALSLSSLTGSSGGTLLLLGGAAIILFMMIKK